MSLTARDQLILYLKQTKRGRASLAKEIGSRYDTISHWVKGTVAISPAYQRVLRTHGIIWCAPPLPAYLRHPRKSRAKSATSQK